LAAGFFFGTGFFAFLILADVDFFAVDFMAVVVEFFVVAGFFVAVSGFFVAGGLTGFFAGGSCFSASCLRPSRNATLDLSFLDIFFSF
jgi:hypothetical protein